MKFNFYNNVYIFIRIKLPWNRLFISVDCSHASQWCTIIKIILIVFLATTQYWVILSEAHWLIYLRVSWYRYSRNSEVQKRTSKLNKLFGFFNYNFWKETTTSEMQEIRILYKDNRLKLVLWKVNTFIILRQPFLFRLRSKNIFTKLEYRFS